MIDFINKLDGVGPVDNRPYTDKLHRFVRKKKRKNIRRKKIYSISTGFVKQKVKV